MSAPTPSPGRPPPATPPAEVVGYNVPSLGYRIVVASLRLIPLFFVLVALPVGVLTFVSSHGIAVPISVAAVELYGLLFIAILTARYILKPTAAYGPLSVAASLVSLLFLYYALSLSPYHLAIPGGSASIDIGFALFLELLMIIPAFGLVAGILTTIEDVRSPKERLPFDYPA